MNYKRLIVSLALPQIAGLAGSFFTVSAIPSWYALLQKPVFSPPNWIFGPVWTVLYIMMGISVYLIWSAYAKAPADSNEKEKRALTLFWIHLFFNAIWSPIFFGLQHLFFALIVIGIIWLLIVTLMCLFWKINKVATYLLIPYLAWVSFASALNYQLWLLNG
jgi:benzodiazapine receptor